MGVALNVFKVNIKDTRTTSGVICGAVVITTAQLHSTKSELRFCAGSNPARCVSDICDGEKL